MDFNVSVEHRYEVICCPCGASTGPWATHHEAETRARRLGWISAPTPHDGVLNFCSDCQKDLQDTTGNKGAN